jgi:hypothetical protein
MVSSIEQNNTFRAILDVVRETLSEPPAIVYVGEISSVLAPLIELSSQLRRGFNAESTVLDPTEPWVSAKDEEKATQLYEIRQKNLRTLGDSNVDYLVVEPLRVAEQLLT